MDTMKKPRKKKKLGKIILAIFLVLVIAVNIALGIFAGHVNLYLGRGDLVTENTTDTADWDSTYNTADYDSVDEVEEAASELNEKISDEGFVLMKNDGALPLASGSKLTLLGRDSADPVYGGSGSGSVSLDSVIDIKTGLENAGFEINDTVYDILSDYASYTTNIESGDREYDNPRADIVMDSPEDSTYYIGEMPVENYTQDAIDSFSDYQDAAIVTIGRAGGEGGDLTQDMEGWDDNYEEGQHQLELNYDEKQAIQLAEENFDKVIVVINSSSIMELGDLEDDDQVDSILWVGSPGQSGFNALGDILDGSVTPSGRTADIYPSDFTKDPTFVNFGNYQYSNISEDNAMGNGYFVEYEEGIYEGYRYYETAAEEGYIDYDEAVVYPFGYGLSYTSFDWEVVDQELGDVDGDITVDVKVTNTGDTYSGKDVVQMYYSAPYYEGGIEKSEVVLGDFAKTSLLAPGESEVVTLTLAVEDMASYDYKEDEAYVLDQGDYEILIQNNSHDLKDGIEPITYTVDDTIVYSGDNHRASDVAEVTNQFDDVNAHFTDTAEDGMMLNFSRSDFAGTFPTAPTEADYVASDDIIEDFQAYDPEANVDESEEMPTTNADNDIQLIELRGKDYDDPLWDSFLDQIDPDTIGDIIVDGAYNTADITDIGKPATVEIDGPAGLNAFMGDTQGMSYTSEVVMASTYNKDLMYELGQIIGNESLLMGVDGWYAPAMNIHRSAFAGRNFEYYSEDPVLSGKLATEVVSGVGSKGVYTYIKHFAMNDQETNRVNNGVSSWANEQAIREIYLKPFEMVIKNATMTIKYYDADEDTGVMQEKEMSAATGVMSSFNRIGGVWAGGNKALMTNVLRNEWGFEGVAVSDFNLYTYMYSNQGIMAGTDYYISFSSMKSMQDTTSATAVNDIRQSAKDMMYTIVNSSAMNGIVPGTIIKYTLSTWRKVQIAVDAVIVILLIVGGVFYWKKRKNQKTI